MRSVDWGQFRDLMISGTTDTLYMVLLSALFTLLIGLPVGVLLFLTRKGACCQTR